MLTVRDLPLGGIYKGGEFAAFHHVDVRSAHGFCGNEQKSVHTKEISPPPGAIPCLPGWISPHQERFPAHQELISPVLRSAFKFTRICVPTYVILK